LFDADPLSATESLQTYMSIEEFKTVVARDVESLLNTRSAISAQDIDQHANVRNSVWAFGLRDFASKSIANADDCGAICRSIEHAIANQESRLTNVRVAIESGASKIARLRFNIQALLLVHPLQEPVSFDAELQTTTQNYAVQTTRRTNQT
jgi:type VI secretion system protein ImpF